MKMQKRTLIISIVFMCIALTLSLAVATYAIWKEQADDFIEVNIPTSDFNPSLKYIVFQGLDGEGNFVSENAVSYAVVGYSGIIGELKIPETYKDLPVTKISCYNVESDTALAGNRFITSVEIPSSVVEIDAGAFANAMEIKSITILGEGNITIGELAFAGCVELTTFTNSRTIEGDENSYFLNTPKLSK